MVVKVSKPEINVREKISELDKPSGTAGQAMLAAETPQEQFNLISAGRRNIIINGAMRVAQRGTSATGIGTAVNYNTVDRWRFADASNPPARFTQTQSTDAPDGFGFSHKFEVTTADTSVAADDMQYTDQFIEAQDLQVLKYGTSNAESFTLSFYVKCSVASTMGLRFTHEDGGGSYGVSYTINATNTWERKSVTIPGNTATAINNDNGRGLRIAFGLSAGSDRAGTDSTAWGNGNIFGAHTNTFVGTSGATWQITGVQLEVGKVATPFEHRSYGEELALCQRYYQVHTHNAASTGSYSSLNFFMYKNGTNVYQAVYKFSPHMRTGPTVTFSSSALHHKGGLRLDTGTFSAHNAKPHVVTLASTPTIDDTSTNPLVFFDGVGATITFDAEL